MVDFVVIAALGPVFGLVFVANSRWAARRGWAYNKHNPRPSGSGIPTMLDESYQPSVEHLAGEQASEAMRADRNESGLEPDAED